MGPEKMIVVPPRHYCVVENPAIKDKDGKPVFDTHGQVDTCTVVMYSHCMCTGVQYCNYVHIGVVHYDMHSTIDNIECK